MTFTPSTHPRLKAVVCEGPKVAWAYLKVQYSLWAGKCDVDAELRQLRKPLNYQLDEPKHVIAKRQERFARTVRTLKDALTSNLDALDGLTVALRQFKATWHNHRLCEEPRMP